MSPQELHVLPTVAVCCITRQRPVMLTALLKSFAALNKPQNVRSLFVVVENETWASCETIVVRELAGHEFIYAIEPVTGIARARNMAVEQALLAGAQAVLFVDDDEEVDADWLTHLVSAWQADHGDILGGPVRVKFEPGAKTAMRRFVERGLKQRFDKRAARKAKKEGQVALCTNNCLIDAKVFITSGLRFDVALLSGEDNELFRQARLNGYRCRWVPLAVVDETWPAERVSFRYFFIRAREQIKADVNRKNPIFGLLAFIGWGTWSMIQFLCVPLSGASGALRAVRHLGLATGHLHKVLSFEARPYARITGG